MLKERYLTPLILDDLKDKMVFVGGPRQVGKTTLCRDFVAPQFKNFAYFNWDNRADRKAISAAIWPGDADLLIFDEIHKYRQWKGFIKGEYDKHRETYKFLVTGSAHDTAHDAARFVVHQMKVAVSLDEQLPGLNFLIQHGTCAQAHLFDIARR